VVGAGTRNRSLLRYFLDIVGREAALVRAAADVKANSSHCPSATIVPITSTRRVR